MGASLGLLPKEGQSLILASAIICISLNPLMFSATEPLQAWVRSRSALARKLERPDDPLAQLPLSTDDKYLAKQVVIVGYGRVGRRIAATLAENDIPFIVVDQNRERVEQLREQGVPAVSGDGSEPFVLIQAHIKEASMLVIATSDSLNARQMIGVARKLNPRIETIVRTHDEEEAALLEQEEAGLIFLAERELAAGMARNVLERFGRLAT